MSNVLVNEEYLSGIANAIRAKNGSGDTYTPGQMASAIGDISGGGSATLITKTVTANGTYSAEDDSADGYSSVTVNVGGESCESSIGVFNYNYPDFVPEDFSGITFTLGVL